MKIPPPKKEPDNVKPAGDLLPVKELARLEALIAQAPEESPELPPPPKPDPATLTLQVWPKRFRDPWARPDSDEWRKRFDGILKSVRAGGLVVILGSRGTGKTRIASEIAREINPGRARYSTAIEFFLEVRSTFRSDARSERDVIEDFGRAPILVLDEVQERAESDWENVNLTTLVDRRFREMRPSILIANLKVDEFFASVGSSIADRVHSDGVVVVMEGESLRGNGGY